MNYGKIAKKFAFRHGFQRGITIEDGQFLIDKEFTPAKLAKAQEAFEKLKERISDKWGMDDID